MAEVILIDTELYEKPSEALDSDLSKYRRVGAKRPRFYRNDIGPFVAGDIVSVAVLKNDKEIERISYSLKAEIGEGNEVRMPLTIEFVEMKEVSQAPIALNAEEMAG